MLGSVRLQLDENELHLRGEPGFGDVFLQRPQSNDRRARLASRVLPRTSEAVDEDNAIVGHSEDRQPRVQVVAQHQVFPRCVFAKRPECRIGGYRRLQSSDAVR